VAEWVHSTPTWNWNLAHADFAPGFLADDGFVPQVGYREEEADIGYRFFPSGFFSRLQPLAGGEYVTDRDGDLISRRYFPGVSFQAQWGLRGELDYNFEAVRIDGQDLKFDRFVWSLSASPSRIVPRLTLAGDYGEQPDVFNVRVGTGGSVQMTATIRPTDHLGLDLLGERQWIDETVDGRTGRLFTAQIARVKAIYVFNSRMLARVIGQYVETTRDASLWTFPVDRKEGAFAGSVLSFPTSSTGRPCSTSATVTTGRSTTEPSSWSPRTASFSSKSPTPSRSRASPAFLTLQPR
jgi:hypothetical protein